jgi:SAM-dependent methyltransferase
MGLELDPGAVQSGRKLGLRVLHGSYEILNNYPSTFDCIIFSHVLEHLHNPIEALRSIKNALKIGGILLISCPNATSIVGEYFGRYWRGLEAPRHLAIPSLNFLRDYLTGMGFSVEQHLPARFPTIKSSMEIMRNNSSASYKQINASLKVRNRLVVSSPEQADFIEFVCIKKLH